MASNRYCIDIAKRGTAGCKECKTKIEKGLCRIGIVVPNPFADGDMKQWFHMSCVFQKLSRSKAATKKIEDEDDLEGWDSVDEEIKEEVRKQIREFWDVNKAAAPKSAKKLKTSPGQKLPSKNKASPSSREPSTSGRQKEPTIDDAFRTFRKVCADIASKPAYTDKTAILASFLKHGSDKKGFDGDLLLWMKLLLPGVDKRVYNLQSKQLVKLFSQIFDTDQEEMIDDLNQGDVAETVGSFFELSTKCKAVKKSTLTIQQVESYLEDLSHLSKEEEQRNLLQLVAKKCTSNDLRMFIRLIKHDLRINAGPKHILKAIHPTAYDAFQASHNLKEVVLKVTKENSSGGGASSSLSVKACVLTPIKPMLAEACGSISKVFEKCKKRPLAEIKYDGERVQVHKSGDEFSYFSRSLKPVMPGKIIHLKEYIPKAFPHGNDLILDSEILLVDSTGTPLPFGTLGEHKKKAFKDANVCLFVFDCIQFNDESLINKPLKYRRKVLTENIKEIKNHVVLSEMKPINSPDDLKEMIESIIRQGLEGLVIKDEESTYEPGKRHWLKMKKDYLVKGGDVKNPMPDTADLLVVGAYYGTGKKGGIMSVFLMACYNERTKKWCTVTKVGGRSDDDLKKLGKSLEVEEINKDHLRVPNWLNVTKSLTPDFIITDPEKSEVWEVKGAEFTKAEVHTADGISIRFPRFVRNRTDKTSKEATTLEELKKMYETSKQTSEIVGLSFISGGNKKRKSSEEEASPSPAKKKKDDSPSSSRSSSPSSPESKRGSKSPASKKISPKQTPTKKTSKRRSASKSPVRKKTLPKKTPTEKTSKSRDSSKSPVRKSEEQQDENVNEGDLDITIKRRITKQFDHALPNVFSGVKLYLSKSLQDYDELRKYFIAFDGRCVKEHEKMNASHYVSTSEDDDFPPTATRISSEWLWDCIKMKQLLPAYLYDVPK